MRRRHVLVPLLFGFTLLAACSGMPTSEGGGGSQASDRGQASGPASGSGSSNGAFSPGNSYPSPSPAPPGGGGSNTPNSPAPPANTNVALGGAQDFGYFRRLIADGKIPLPSDFDAAGFFAEHHTKLPPPACGQRVCLQTLMAVMPNLSSGQSTTMLQLGLNSTIVADPAQRPPLDLVVTVDVSGSMNAGGKIDFVRAGLVQLVEGLRDVDRFALVTYSDQARLARTLTEVGPHRAELRALVSSLVANGSTALYDGLAMAYGEALQGLQQNRQTRVLLLSDGQPTVGITSTDQILTMSRAFNADGIGLTTIGVGTDFNPLLMRGLSEQADGNFYFLENPGAVKEVFADELDYFTVPVAFDLELDLVASPHYKFGKAHGSSFWKDDHRTGGQLKVPSVFLAHRRAHDDQTAEGGRRGGGSALLIELFPSKEADDGSGLLAAEVAQVRVSFREPGPGGKVVTAEVAVAYPHAPWETPEEGFFRSDDVAVVQKSFVMLNLYTAFERACRTFHTGGDRGAIVPYLRRLRAAVVDYNEEIGDQDIVADLRLLDDFIALLLRQGVADPAVPLPADPWPAD